ncbi:MAG: DUF1667 domain-containing protein [Candidatus Humimicrobiaceae bacterium]
MNNIVNCIICPKSCKIKVFKENNDIKTEGGGCRKGRTYAINEFIEPRRIFTTTIRVENSNHKVIPVKTSKAIKKEYWREAKRICNDLKVNIPVSFNAVLFKDFLEKDIDLISTREVLKKYENL